MAKRIRKLILPFAVPEKDRVQALTKQMEMAAIFYFAEMCRKKEGRVLKKPKERIAFIAETCYPIWLIPWKGRTLIFDGLEFTNPSISYDVLPDVKAFENDIRISSKSHEAYISTLSQNASYFQNFAGKEATTVKGLITNPSFTQDLVDYLQDLEIRKDETTKAILSPLLDESEVSDSICELSELRETFEEEIKVLSRCMKLLSKETRKEVKSLHAEIKSTINKFDNKIKKVKPKVMKEIKRIQEKRDNEITIICKKYDRQLRSLHQKRVRMERTVERLSNDVERIEVDIKGCREKRDEVGELQLSDRCNRIKKKLPLLNKEIKKVDRKIENVEDAKTIEVSRARTKQDDCVEEAMRALRDIEAAKEARIRLEQQQLSDLEEKSSYIIKQIDAMVKSKEAALNEINSIGASERRKYALAYLPIYFVCYETEGAKRYVVYPPSWVGSMGIKTKLKGVFGAGKMKSFLKCRSQAITTLLDRVVDLTQENPVFEKEIMEAGVKANILRTTELKIGIRKGLTELKNEGWISENELQILSNELE